MRSSITAIFLSALILAGCNESTVGPGDPNQSDSEIYYTKVSPDGKMFSVSAIKADGTGKRELLADAALLSAPVGNRFAGVKRIDGDAGLPVLCDLDGKVINTITLNDGDFPVLSPSGSRISYGRSSPYELRVVNSDGTNDILIDQSEENDLMYAWSPDGNRLAYVKESGEGWQFPDSVFVVNADGTNRRFITAQQMQMWDDLCTFDWSPDGSHLVSMIEVADDLYEIFTINVSTGVMQKITNDGVAKYLPMWSPDGRRIAFLSYDGDDGNYTRSYITIIDPDGGNAREFTLSTSHYVIYPQWSPDSKKIVVTELNAEGNDPQFGTLKVLNVADGSITILEASAYRAFWKK